MFIFHVSKHITYSFRNALGFIKRTYRREGFLALYRGNTATLARIIPYSAVQFAAFEQYRRLLNVDNSDNPKLRRFLAGAMAGVTSQSATYPLDLARARMAVTDKFEYKNIFEVFRSIYTKENGLRSLYRGYLATVIGVIPYAGMSFLTYETLKAKYFGELIKIIFNSVNPRMSYITHLSNNPISLIVAFTGETKTNAMYSLMFGAIAGITSQTASYPLDIVRRRMQTSGIDNFEKYDTIRQTLRRVYTEEGILRGFYKGLSMNWVKGPLAVGISFSSYDTVKQFLTSIYNEQ